MAPKQALLQIFIQANVIVGKKRKNCQERPHLVSGRFIKVFYKTTTCQRRPVLSGPKSLSFYTGLTVLGMPNNANNAKWKSF